MARASPGAKGVMTPNFCFKSRLSQYRPQFRLNNLKVTRNCIAREPEYFANMLLKTLVLHQRVPRIQQFLAPGPPAVIGRGSALNHVALETLVLYQFLCTWATDRRTVWPTNTMTRNHKDEQIGRSNYVPGETEARNWIPAGRDRSGNSC